MRTDDGEAIVDLSAEDLFREVYCVLGVPIDALDMEALLTKIEQAVEKRRPFFLSTPNLNFLANSWRDDAFRASLVESDACTADGVSVVFIAHLLNARISGRVAGADILNLLNGRRRDKPLKVFLFGGDAGVAEAAKKSINDMARGVVCVGALDPGRGTVEEMSDRETLRKINSSGADILAVALGASKGQRWLLQNAKQLEIPVRAHLGASLNFVAGTVRRAPRSLQALGLEWLWRIKEEPYLWRRYWDDGLFLLNLMIRQLAVLRTHFALARREARAKQFSFRELQEGSRAIFALKGPATARSLDSLADATHKALVSGAAIDIDFREVTAVDARFLGFLMTLGKASERLNLQFNITHLSPGVRRVFVLNNLGYLLDDAQKAQMGTWGVERWASVVSQQRK
jgi:N-acetylglucosaminyldiphosphoundecaprenol N-acetyl-beta-D-mannosaminyltransferase